MSDRIVLHDMVFQGRHGVTPAEQLKDQPFHLDIEMVLNLQPAAVEDDLARTVDYAAVFEVARTVVESTSFRLIEALAEAVAQEVLTAFPCCMSGNRPGQNLSCTSSRKQIQSSPSEKSLIRDPY